MIILHHRILVEGNICSLSRDHGAAVPMGLPRVSLSIEWTQNWGSPGTTSQPKRKHRIWCVRYESAILHILLQEACSRDCTNPDCHKCAIRHICTTQRGGQANAECCIGLCATLSDITRWVALTKLRRDQGETGRSQVEGRIVGWLVECKRQGSDPTVMSDPSLIPQAGGSSLWLIPSTQICATFRSVIDLSRPIWPQWPTP